MSLLTLIKAQFGKSNTPANNFVLDASADNGTLKLARGNAGATTQDILTVDAAGNINAPVSIQKAGSVLQALSDFSGTNVSLATNGYQKLPSGLIIQWGRASIVNGNSYTSISFPIAFPNAVYSLTGTSIGNAAAGLEEFEAVVPTTTGFQCLIVNGAGAGVNGLVHWIAIGY